MVRVRRLVVLETAPPSLAPSATRVVARRVVTGLRIDQLGQTLGELQPELLEAVRRCPVRWQEARSWLVLSLAASDRACVLRARAYRVWVNIQGTECGLNVCGEGGEYETFTTDCPLYKRRIVLCVSTRPPSHCTVGGGAQPDRTPPPPPFRYACAARRWKRW